MAQSLPAVASNPDISMFGMRLYTMAIGNERDVVRNNEDAGIGMSRMDARFESLNVRLMFHEINSVSENAATNHQNIYQHDFFRVRL